MDEKKGLAFVPVEHIQPIFQVESASPVVRGLFRLVQPLVIAVLRAVILARALVSRGRHRPPPNEEL